jgi:hypothetical protein
MMNVLGVHTGEAGAWQGEDHWDDEMVGTERDLSPEIDDPWVGRPHEHSSNIGAQPGHPMGFTINKYWAPVFAARMNGDNAFRPTQLAQLDYAQHPSISQQQLRQGEDGEAKLRVAGGGWRTVKLALLGAAEARGLDDCALYCTQEQPVQLLQSPKTKIIPNRPPRCGCPKPLPPPRLINGENCEDIVQNPGETSGVRWLIDCPDKWLPSRRPAAPKVTQQEEPPVGPDVSAHYSDAIEMPPGEEEPEIEKDEPGCEPDIFAPQEPCWESNNNPGTKFTCFTGTKVQILTPAAPGESRNEWYFDYEAPQYTAQYDDAGGIDNYFDKFTPDEPWNDRSSTIVLDDTLADVRRSCLAAGAKHVWNSETHECVYEGEPSYQWPEMPRARGVTQEGPSRYLLQQ